MLLLDIVIAATIVLAPLVGAQEQADQQRNYTVWASVVLTRTGDRTPEVVVVNGDRTKLTSLGANQAFAAGTYFRNRYITWQNGTNGMYDAGAPLRGLDPDVYDDNDVYAMALDQQWNTATAQAFLQGFYPAVPSPNETADLSSRMSDGTWITGPLGGMQYPRIRTPLLGVDPGSIYLDAGAACAAFEYAASDSIFHPEIEDSWGDYSELYQDVGARFMGGVRESHYFTYQNAYAIYDYLRYRYEREESVARQLDALVAGTDTSYIDTLKELADQQLWYLFGDFMAMNHATGETGLPGGIRGSISTIPGNFFAATVFRRLANAVYNSEEFQPLSLYFADLPTFMSLFALLDLPMESSNFYGMPNFGASAVFELWSWANASITQVPDPDDLYVRFLFRNGTDANDTMLAYSLFNRPKDEFNMRWSEFEPAIRAIGLAGTQNWCNICGNDDTMISFCAAAEDPEPVQRSGPSPVVAGVIGAVVTLAVAALLFGALMLIGGVRLHRNGSSRRKSELGGFKGGQKMASDQDLTIPKGGAMVGATVQRHPHERSGSWELRQAEAGEIDGNSARPSMEQVRPVQPRESI